MISPMSEDICQVGKLASIVGTWGFYGWQCQLVRSVGVGGGRVYHSITSAMITTDNDNHQVRLNFEEVELLDPDSTGACRTDYMHVTGGVSQVPIWSDQFLIFSHPDLANTVRIPDRAAHHLLGDSKFSCKVFH